MTLKAIFHKLTTRQPAWLKLPAPRTTRGRAFKRHMERIVPALVVVVLVGTLGEHFLFTSHADTGINHVTGQDYQICDLQSQYLTSPWTYHALASGSQSYTVAQYQALTGYGTTLPPLPSYIASQPSSTTAAVIYAPGGNANQPAYNFPNSPLLYFFEGGAYGQIGLAAVSGDQFIGGSTTGYPEPTFDNGHGAGGISAQDDSHDAPNNTTAIAHLTAAAAQGATSITLSASSIPQVQWSIVMIGGHDYTISGVSGGQSAYTLTLEGGLDAAAAANTSVYYDGLAGGVTVSYLDIAHDEHNTTGTIYTGAGWTVTHNNIHDGYSTQGSGVGFYGGDQGTVEYNCFSKMGVYGMNIFGTNNKFDYNEVYESNYNPDPGCGCSGGGKWWATLNADIDNNAFVGNGYGGGGAIWLDNGNSGSDISGNYFYKTYSNAISSETGFNLNITGNLFLDDNWGNGTGCGDSNCTGDLSINSSGGFHVPGSRYDNQILISGNQFMNDWGGVGVWQAGERSCENSGEDWPRDAPYCSGGYPNTATVSGNTSSGQYYFSHIGDSTYGGGTRSVTQAASAGATTLLVDNGGNPEAAEAINDQIGFSDPTKTTTSSTTNVTSLSNSTINATSTTGFPSSGQLRVGTSAAWGDSGGSYTGAILSYTGTTATSFTGVSLVRGSGTLAGPVQQIQPYTVTGETCYANDCKLTVTPALTGAVSAGTTVTNAGTCQLFATSAATPTSPLAPDGTSYFDGCQWGTKNITVTSNIFTFDPTAIAGSTTIKGTIVGASACTSAHANNCGINFMAYQESGEPPFSSFIGANAMMSNSALTGCPAWDSGCTTNPLKNINALSNPPSAAAHNNEPPENDVWSNNSYYGPWQWDVYWYGSCNSVPSDPTTNKSMPSGACTETFPEWQSDWQQEAGSTYSATVTTPQPPSTPSGVQAVANSSTSVTVTWNASTDTGGPGLSGYYVYRDGTQIGQVGASILTYTDTTATAATQYSYTVRAYDTSSVTSAASTAATVTTPSSGGGQTPTVSLTSFPDNTKVHGSGYSLSASAAAAAGNTIAQVQLLINNTVVQTLTATPYTFTIPTNSYANGSYTVLVRATDNQGNANSASATCVINNGDFNNDNKISIADLSIMAGNWNKQSGATFNQGDTTGDGKVTIADLSVLASKWGQSW